MNMKPEDYSETIIELAGWPVRLISYKLGEKYICKVDNVSPGANIARTEGATKEEAEAKATELARSRLSLTRTLPI